MQQVWILFSFPGQTLEKGEYSVSLVTSASCPTVQAMGTSLAVTLFVLKSVHPLWSALLTTNVASLSMLFSHNFVSCLGCVRRLLWERY